MENEVQNEAANSIRFYTRPILDSAATKEAGRAIHRDAVYLEICNPGDRTNVVDRPFRDSDKEMYPRHWAAFERGNSQEAVVGTRLAAWGHLSAARVEDLKYMKIQTVEQLASVPDSTLHTMGLGARAERQAALDFIEAAKSRGPILRLEAQLQEERAQRASLEQMLKQQSDRLDALAAGKDVRPVRELEPAEAEAAPKAKRGRPAKTQAQEA